MSVDDVDLLECRRVADRIAAAGPTAAFDGSDIFGLLATLPHLLDYVAELERQRDALAEALVNIADAGCSAGWGDCSLHYAQCDDRGDWCDECTAADALHRAGLR